MSDGDVVELRLEDIVLFVTPYNPEETELMRLGGVSEAEKHAAYLAAQTADPGLSRFLSVVDICAQKLDLAVFMPGDDLVILIGEQKSLEDAKKALESDYDCHLNTVESLQDTIEEADECDDQHDFGSPTLLN